MKFAMTDSEIITSYQHARDQKAQVQVLAELNGTTKDEMKQKLYELGCLAEPPVLREKNIKPAFDKNRARELFAEGMSDLDIAERLGVSVTVFATWRRANGMKRPMGGARQKQVEPAPCVTQPPIPIEEEMQEPQPEFREEKSVNSPAELPPIRTDAGELGRLLVELSERYPDIRVTVGGMPVTGLRLNVHMNLASMKNESALDLEVSGSA